MPYGLPHDELERIRERDKFCVYCHKQMRRQTQQKGLSQDQATIEHLNTHGPWDNPGTVVICCGSCNASRGAKELPDWFKKSFCIERQIDEEKVADPVRKYLVFEKFVNRLSWTFAKTMPQIPHFYVVRNQMPENDMKTFDDFAAYIASNGYTRKFGEKFYNYVNIEKFKYWMDDDVLNRAELAIDE